MICFDICYEQKSFSKRTFLAFPCWFSGAEPCFLQCSTPSGIIWENHRWHGGWSFVMSMFKLPSIYHMLILWKSKNSALIAIYIIYIIYTHLSMYLYIGVYIKGRCFRKGLNQPILGKVLHRTSTRIQGQDHLGEINHLQKGVCWRHTGVQRNQAISTMKTIYNILQPLSADISTIVWSHWPIGPSLSGEEHVPKKAPGSVFYPNPPQTKLILFSNSSNQLMSSIFGIS